ncbi:hypothetical protein Bca4012_068429 [Brassica carinata]|uniref:Uncharacterized protein n=1 Tax=Brassica carinata TaxID=52824 RepID=A0A8X7VTH5_BRACI|nr:hypothetical protein Bca52824_020656 [Brassica carinata]
MIKCPKKRVRSFKVIKRVLAEVELCKDAKKALTEERPRTSNLAITVLISVNWKGRKIKASVIICFTSSGRSGRLIGGTCYIKILRRILFFFCNIVTYTYWFKGESTSAMNELVLKVALDHGKQAGVITLHEREVVC